DALDRVADQLGVAGALFVGRYRADQRLGLRREDLGGRAQDLGRALAEEHVLGLHLEVCRDGFGELAGLVGVAARLWPALEQRAHRIEHLLARSDRVLVARDADDVPLHGLEVGLDRGPHAMLTAAAPDAAGQSRAGTNPDSLDKTSSCKRHWLLLQSLPRRR